MSDITKNTRVLTADEEAMKKYSNSENKPDIEKLRKQQEKAILKRELGREKIVKLSKQGASNAEKIQALGIDKLTPLQLTKFHSNIQNPSIENVKPDISLTEKFLGSTPSVT